MLVLVVDCLDLQGRTAEGRQQFEPLLATANDLGLVSDPTTRAELGAGQAKGIQRL